MSTAKGPLKGRAARLGRLMPSGPSSAARTPFVLLVFVLLGGGLIALLLLNSALNQGSFKLRELKDRTTELTDQEQALQRDVDDYAAPDALERRARELGMVPGGSPAFLGPDGKVLGEPSVAVSPKPSPTPTPSAKAAPKNSPPASPPKSTAATRTSTTTNTGVSGSPTSAVGATASTSTPDATITGTGPTGSAPTGPGPTGISQAPTAPAAAPVQPTSGR